MPYEVIRPEQLRGVLGRLQANIYVPVAELAVSAWVTPEPVPYGERRSGRPVQLQAGDRWGELWDCAWFHFSGSVPERAKDEKVVLLIDVNGELCLVDEDGSPVQGLTNINSEFDFSLGLPGKRVVHVSERSSGDEAIDLWGDAGCNDLFGRYRSGTLKEAVVAICREELRQLYYDFEVLLETAERLPAGSARKERIFRTLHDASHRLAGLTEEEIAQARSLLGEQLAKRGGDPVLTISAVGHAHIDLAWLWPIRETIRKGARTFSTALSMMERYPDYVFGASQPQLYEWMKIHYPKLYGRIKERVAEGRWEPQGAMWVESDTNVPGGESLVRQLLYGKRYFQQEFGQEMKSLWMPDVFGYTASLPQLLKKAGVDYMMTQKLSWSVYNRHPHHTFMWEGIDGSQVLTHMPPEDTYNSPAAPRSIVKAEQEYLDKGISDRALMLFGIGDGGGGPGEEHLERLARERDLLGLSPVEQEPSSRFFERLAEGSERYETWRGELYLEKHQGTLTSQGRSKRYNRKLEKALRELEFAAVLAGMADGSPYPARELEEIWKEVLLYQFHDILPGSSIKRVYDESLERYAVLLDKTERMTEAAYASAAGGASGTAVFNSLPWEREEWLRLDGRWQLVRVPAMGFVTVGGAASGAKDAAEFPDLRASAEGRVIENGLLALAFDAEGGITSILDKEAGRELVQPGRGANALRVYSDDGDAWDFRQDYRAAGGTSLRLEEVEAFADGPKAGLTMRYAFGGSILVQRVVLTEGSRRIDFETKVDWKESGKMLRTSFPLGIRCDSVSCDIQFGYLKRPTHRNTMWDYAKDEICAHHYADLSEPDYGVALLNDCKYGHRAEGGELDLNLLRSPSYPDPEADRAEHEFTYSLYPHAGDHVQAGIYRRGYELNVPLRTVAAASPSVRSSGDGAEPTAVQAAVSACAAAAETAAAADMPSAGASSGWEEGRSFLLPDHPHVMVEAVKRAEDDGDLVIRLYETAGTRLKTTVRAGFALSEAWLADLMEQKQHPLEISGGAVELAFDPFEVKTLKLSLQP
ncbi:alpha-mannosidase [Paenibacillus sp. D9]|uniref:alpha-mannosidase n=1 Tax=Paenibacillus sp. D9 TaxID=665792 RepID=UPI00061FFF6C|nr:glycoside hydrolase family 38 C-terminal domain-containing protein [Paenibacillus sp. D9]KKC46846.1 alpha-mannosidase [Paenibacillus sp. D9]